jgi:hypothetical protein
MAHLEFVEEDINAPAPFDIVEDQSFIARHCVENFSRGVAQVSEKFLYLAGLAFQCQDVYIGVLAFQRAVCCTWTVKSNCHAAKKPKGDPLFVGGLNYPLSFLNYVCEGSICHSFSQLLEVMTEFES